MGAIRNGVLLSLLLASWALPVRAWQRDPDAGRIAGRVVEQGSGKPVSRVMVTLVTWDGLRVMGAVETDRNGRFEFRGLSEELLSLRAERLGYFIRAGRHSMTPADWTVYMDFADRWLK